jgi:hypothetical protein
MKRLWQELALGSVIGLVVLLGAARGVSAQTPEQQFFASPSQTLAEKISHGGGVLTCRGSSIKSIADVAFEGFKLTPFIFKLPAAGGGGGGEGGCFDPTPVLSTTVTLPTGFNCLNAHFSAIVGSKLTYGAFFPLGALAVFQVTLTPVTVVAPPQHMVGHYETPYGLPCPAIGIEAEKDVDTFGSNFFQRVGTQPGDVPPGTYKVDVWWAGAPPFGTGGAFAGDFVLKLYGG